MLGIARVLLQQVIRDLHVQLRLASARHRVRRKRLACVERVALLDAPPEGEARRICMRGRNGHELVVLQDAHQAPVCEPRHAEVRELFERRMRVEPGREHGCRVGQELRLDLAPALLRHVAPDVDDQVWDAVFVQDCARPDQ